MRSLLLLLCFVACTALAVAQVSSTQRQEFLEVHNNARLSSNLPRTPAQALPALVWSDELASIAQDFAFSCPGGHSGHPGLGENLAWGPASAADAVRLWEAEKSDYDYPSNSCNGVCGHYTQMIWEDTAEIGCGIHQCSNPNILGGLFLNVYVCNYRSFGNIIGHHPYVAASSKREAEAIENTCPDFIPTSLEERCAGRCGQFEDACGQFDCLCGLGDVCTDSGTCCEPQGECGEQCGAQFNGCEWVDCGPCPGECASSCPVDACGFVSQGECGGPLNCGECGTGRVCLSNQCFDSACSSGCGVNQECDEAAGVCRCLPAHVPRVPSDNPGTHCDPVGSGASEGIVGDWEISAGDGDWYVVGNEIHLSDTGYNELFWISSAEHVDGDSTFSVEIGGMETGDRARVGFFRSTEVYVNKLAAEFELISSTEASVQVCEVLGDQLDCFEPEICEVEWNPSNFTLVEVRVREIESGKLEVFVTVDGVPCEAFVTIEELDVLAYLPYRAEVFIGADRRSSSGTISFRRPHVTTTTTMSLALSECMSDEQVRMYLSSAMGIPIDSIEIVSMGDGSLCNNRKRAEAVGGSAVVFTVQGTPTVSSGAAAAQFTSLVQSSSASAASVGGGIAGAGAAKLAAAEVGIASAAASVTATGGAAAGGGGGGGGGLGVGGIVGLAVGLPVAAVLIVGLAVVAGGGAYYYSQKERGGGGGGGSVDRPDSEKPRGSFSRRIRKMFGVNVMGADGSDHQSITARAPPIKT